MTASALVYFKMGKLADRFSKTLYMILGAMAVSLSTHKFLTLIQLLVIIAS